MSGEGGKKFAPKIRILYQQAFESRQETNDQFWNELLLIKPRPAILREITRPLSSSSLLELKRALCTFFARCAHAACVTDISRQANALKTCAALIDAITFKRSAGHDILNALIGNDAPCILKNLIEKCMSLLDTQVNQEETLQSAAFEFLFSMTMASEIVNSNAFLEALIVTPMFETFVAILANPPTRLRFGRRTLTILSVLLNYRKYDNCNPYIMELSILDNEVALHGYSQVVARALDEKNQDHKSQLNITNDDRLPQSFSSWITDLFVSDDLKNARTTLRYVSVDCSMLLALYEIVHLNRNFMSMLTSLSSSELLPKTPTTHVAASVASLRTSSRSQCQEASPNDIIATQDEIPSPSPSVSSDLSSLSTNCINDPPINLMSVFLTYSSSLLHNCKDAQTRIGAKLCAIILTCITEDQLASSLMHDITLSFRVPLYRPPMRHRPGSFDSKGHYWPLACTTLDLTQEFITSHLKLNFPFEIFGFMVSIIHRIVVFERRFRTRIQFSWRQHWNALISFLKFVTSNEQHFITQISTFDALALCSKVITVLNLFITFGDTFLPSPLVYDYLYYEIIRNSDVFDALYAMACRHIIMVNGEVKTTENTLSDDSVTTRSFGNQISQSAQRLKHQMSNVMSITENIKPLLARVPVGSLTESEALEVVRQSYDTLTLILFDNLDIIQPYNERRCEAAFLSTVVKHVITLREY